MVLVEVSAPEKFRSSPRGKVVVSSGNDEEAEGSVSRCSCERVREREAERERERVLQQGRNEKTELYNS